MECGFVHENETENLVKSFLKTHISRLENGKADVQLNTLFRIFGGLGRRVELTIH